MPHDDPFTGAWNCDSAKSRFSIPPRLGWRQHISASPTHLRFEKKLPALRRVRRSLVLPRNSMAETTPCKARPVAIIAYTRRISEIIGIARRGGFVCLRETLVVAPDRLTMVMK